MAEIRTLRRGSVAYCLAVRDLVLWGIAARCGFREENYDLSYSERQDGEFRQRGGAFEIAVWHRRFKNWRGPYFKIGKDKYRDYYKQLDDDGVFNWAAREWLGFCRPLLLGKDRHSDRLFLGRSGDDIKASGLGQALMATYNRYVLWNPAARSGIEGAGRTGPHFARAVLASSVLKETGSPAAAAAAIHDSVKTVMTHYATLLGDFDGLLRDTLAALLKRSKPDPKPGDQKTGADKRPDDAPGLGPKQR